MQEREKERVYLKFIFLGASKSGKTSIIRRYIENKYSEHLYYTATIPADYRTRFIQDIDPNKTLFLQVWDKYTGERFGFIPPDFFKYVNASFIVFDITNRDSFNYVKEEITRIPHDEPNQYRELYIVGNKSDLESHRVINRDEANQLAQDNAAKYIEVSAKDNINVYQSFDEIAKSLFFKKINDPSSFPPSPPSSFCTIL
ncbi:hypothetical protein CYY_003004 [Polysphondylium violaceum]|uniref:Rab GTPase n=1 Tax=Polysphondylium violaceum TaxID=133409 RepID=A0A8J4UUN5_9MYCE|nr:hypothetical protein CYY_003004 [Polysphondylium violaceum]